MAAARSRMLLLGAIAACLVLALGGQAVGDALVPDASGADTNRAVGRAASSYLLGIRRFGAAVLWNRLDPIMHGYYGGTALEDMRYMLSSIAAIQALDPESVQSYYVGSWILIQNGRTKEGMEMAERGVAANPDAGILRVNLAQLRMLYADDLPGAVEMAETALGPDLRWTDVVEQHDAYPILGAIFRVAGRSDLEAQTQAALERMDEEAGDAIGEEGHDHDNDGAPDH